MTSENEQRLGAKKQCSEGEDGIMFKIAEVGEQSMAR